MRCHIKPFQRVSFLSFALLFLTLVTLVQPAVSLAFQLPKRQQDRSQSKERPKLNGQESAKGKATQEQQSGKNGPPNKKEFDPQKLINNRNTIFQMVQSGVPTNSRVNGLVRLLPEDQRMKFRIAAKGKGDGTCVITSEVISMPPPKITEGTPSENGDFICTPITVEETVSNKEIYILGNLNKLYPGMVLDANQLTQGQYVDIQDKRNPFSLVYANGPTLNGKSFVKVDRPAFDTVNAAHNRLLKQGITGKTPANMTYDVERVYSLEHLNLKIGANVNYASASVSSRFDIDWAQEKSRLLITFKQIFYELHAERMVADKVFAERTAQPEDAYVSRVAYGRLLMFLVESDTTSNELELAVDAAVKAGIGSAEVTVDATYEKIVESSEVQVYVQGGSAEAAVASIISGAAGIKEYINDGVNFDPNQNPGSPMIFEITYLQSGLTANVIASTSYEYSVCYLNTGRFNLTLKNIECTETPFGNKHAKLYGTITVGAYLWDPAWETLVLMEGTPSEKTIVIDVRNLGAEKLWSHSKENPVYLEKGERAWINETFRATYKDLKDIDLDKSYLQITFDLYEKDTAQNDKMDIPAKKIYLSDLGVPMDAGSDLENAVDKSYKFNDKNNFDFKLTYTAGPG